MAVVQARNFVLAHLSSALASDDLAGATGLSPRALGRALFDHTGHGPMGFILMIRLDKARTWLCSNREIRTQAEIAAALGFRSCAAFSRAYSRRFGETMTQTRGRAVRSNKDRQAAEHNSRDDCVSSRDYHEITK